MSNESSGHVSLIGAGPGDPELITLRAIRHLRRADIVFHDKLSPGELIDKHCDSSVVVRDVGKRKGKKGPDQSEINESLYEASQTYKNVVRLKGGDPYLFGRGGEEASYLSERDVSFEVIPGISSLLAVPNYAGVPATQRRHSSSMAVFTGHLGSRETELPWSSLSDIDTLIVMMGITRADRIAQNLIDAGRDSDTPVSVIGWGTTPEQTSIQLSLAELTEGLENQSRFLPGLIVIGQVVNDRESLNWFENRPLFGRRIVLTRPAHQIQGMADLLRERGARPLKAPTISIEPLDDGLTRLENQFDHLDEYDWIVFTSRNGVRFFFEHLGESGRDTRSLGSLRTAAIGPGTAEELRKHGCMADVVPDEFKAEGLTQRLVTESQPEHHFLLPRAAGARDVLKDQLREANRTVREIPIYESVPETDSRSLIEEGINKKSMDMITFTSASTVDNLFRMFEEERDRLKQWINRVDLATIGPITASRLEERGFSVDVVPDQYTIDGLVNAIETYYRSQTQPAEAPEL